MRPDLLELEGYAHASSLRDLTRLHANEAPVDPRGRRDGLNRYPAPEYRRLAAVMASYYGCSPARVLPVRGSDDAIDLLVRSFCRAGRDAILVCSPTFGIYAAAARLQGAAIIDVPLDRGRGFLPDFDGILRGVDAGATLVFVCSPNNPTGGRVHPDRLTRLADDLRGRALLVVDEAYVEFSGSPGLASSIDDSANLTVLRTLSKAFGLAGIRCGALIGPSDLLERLRSLMPPYPLSLHTVTTARRYLGPTFLGRMRQRVERIRSERERLATSLARHPGVSTVWPSEGNFLLVEPTCGADSLVDACRDRGLLVRRIADPTTGLDAVRVTIGDPEENERFVAALDLATERARA